MIAAGSDVALVCSGDLAETEAVAAVVPPLAGAVAGPLRARLRRICGNSSRFDVAEAEACLAQALRADA